MSEELKKFLEMLSKDVSWRERAAKVETEEEFIEIAREAGFELTKEDMTPKEELDEEEMDAVSGGRFCFIIGEGHDTRKGKYCFCVIEGSGGDDPGDMSCKFFGI